MCGDSTSVDAVERLMAGAKAQLLHADPPYGMGKEGEGVANDNIYGDKLDAFQMEWWATFRTFLENNASVYIWGNAPDLWRLWYCGGLSNSERMTIRNEIVWDKKAAGAGGISHMGADGFRQFPNATERCLFFMIGEQGFNNNADNYWEGWEPIRSYLENEMKRCGWTTKDLNNITGTQMAGHWVTKSQWAMITADHYAKIQKAARDHDAFKRDHDAFKRDHDALKRDFYATRACFDNTHDNMTDVWEFPRVTGGERHGHATPKPVAMMERVMKSSLPKGGICVEPFGGSGSTLMGAEKTGRICYTMELQAKYVDVIVKRWEEFTGQKARLENAAEIST
jgi:DNA modification methylase